MQRFIENTQQIIREYNEIAAATQKKAFITVGIEIQEKEINNIKNYRQKLVDLKKQFVESHLSDEANLVYCIDSSMLAVQYELQMLIHIKEDKMNEAWGNLVNAQVTFGTVLRNYPQGIKPAKGYIERLEAYEKLLFPPMFFSSVGGIIKKSHCSICNQNYSKCNHIKGRLYYGELCTRIITEMELEEVSFVSEPANKHCRIINTTYAGKTIDCLTLREEPQFSQNHKPAETTPTATGLR